MRVAIIFPHVGYCTGWRPHLAREVKNGATYHIAQALTYLYSTARQHTPDVRVFDFNFGGDEEENLGRVLDYRPDAVLISSTVNSYDSTRSIARALAASRVAPRLFIGGPAVSSNYYLRPALVRVEADCEFVVTHRNIFNWTGQVFGEDRGVKFRGFEPDNGWIEETYPPESLDKIRYTVITSIGCTYKCSFCLNPKVYNINYKSADVLRSELRHLRQRYGATAVSVADPFFFMDQGHADAMMDVLAESGMTWSQQTCLVTLTDENLARMSETMCTSVLVGIENFATKEIDKPVDAKRFEDRVRLAKELNITVKPSFISGLLDIEYEQDVAQIEYIHGLIEDGLIADHQLQSNIYTPYIPDARDRLLNVPFRFWGVLPVTARDEEDWEQKLSLCDLIYERIFSETLPRYREVRAEYLEHVRSTDDVWLHHAPVPTIEPMKLTTLLTSGRVRVPMAGQASASGS